MIRSPVVGEKGRGRGGGGVAMAGRLSREEGREGGGLGGVEEGGGG